MLTASPSLHRLRVAAIEVAISQAIPRPIISSCRELGNTITVVAMELSVSKNVYQLFGVRKRHAVSCWGHLKVEHVHTILYVSSNFVQCVASFHIQKEVGRLGSNAAQMIHQNAIVTGAA